MTDRFDVEFPPEPAVTHQHRDKVEVEVTPAGVPVELEEQILQDQNALLRAEALLDDMTDPWDQQEHESTEAFAGFIVYRDMGPGRRIKDAARLHMMQQVHGVIDDETDELVEVPVDPDDLRRCAQRFGAWSSRNGWRARAAAWDRYLDSQHRSNLIEAARAATERHIRLARKIQSNAERALLSDKFDDLSAKQLSEMIAEAAKMERLALGASGADDEKGQSDAKVRNLAVILLQQPDVAKQLDRISQALDEPDAQD